MATWAIVLFCICTCASDFCVAVTNLEQSCSWELDKHVCAMPSAFWSGGSIESDCTVGISMIIKLQKPVKYCETLKLENVLAFHNAYGMQLSFDYNESFYVRRDELFNYVYLKMRASQIVKVLSIHPRDHVLLEYRPEYENSECYIWNRCYSSVNEYKYWTPLEFKMDHAPSVQFEVFEKFSVARNPINDATKKTVPLVINSALGEIAVIASVQDNDVFHSNEDIFEYSAISKLDVTVSAVVHFSDKSNEDAAHSVERKLDTRSGNCKLIVWCEEDQLNKSETTRNQAQKQFRLKMSNLDSAVQVLYVQSKLSNRTFTRVSITFEVTAASGMTNRLTTTDSFTVAVVLPQRLFTEVTAETTEAPTTCSCESERSCKNFIQTRKSVHSRTTVLSAGPFADVSGDGERGAD